MRIRPRFLLVLIIALMVTFPVQAAGSCESEEALPQKQEFRDDRVLVKLTREAADLAVTPSENHLPRGIAGLDDLLERRGIWQGHRLIRTYGVPIGDPELFTETGLDRWYVLILPEPGRERVQSLIRDLRREQVVELAEVVEIGELLNSIPNDPLFDLQWQNHNTGQTGGTVDADMDSPEAWDIVTGSSTGIVGLLDTGVDHDHEDLVGAITAGFNFIDENDDIEDDEGHGTSTSGLVAARGNNGIGVAGVCYDCMVMPLRIFDETDRYDVVYMINAIRWGADNGADAIGSMSSPYLRSQALIDAVEYAMGRGTLMLCANGNMYTAQSMALSTIPGVVAVGATNHNDNRVLSYGDHLSVSAPGWDTYTTAMDDSYRTFSGTCPSVALASGIAGLLRAEDESLHVNEMRHLLELGADDQVGVPEEDTSGWDRYMGYGRVNAFGSLSLIDGPWLAMDRPHYMCAGELTVALKDKAAGSSVDVILSVGSGSDTETVTVVPLTDQGYFEGSIPISWAGKDGPAVTQDGKLDMAHGDAIVATVGGLSAEAFVDCVKTVCNVPDEDPVAAAGDCDGDRVADPGELWSMGIAMISTSTEPLPDVVVVIETDDPNVELLNDTIMQELLEFDMSYPGISDGDTPALFRMKIDTPLRHSALFRVISIHGAGWENDPALCETYFGEPTISVLANRDLGPVLNLWDFDEGTVEGFTSEVAHGTGDLSECEMTSPWRNEWEELPVTDRYHAGGYSMRIGNGHYYNPRNDAGLMTPVFDVPEDGGALTFYTWMNTYVYDDYRTFDGFTVEAKPVAESIWAYLSKGTYAHHQVYSGCWDEYTVPFGWAEPVNLFAGDGEGGLASGDLFDRQQHVELDRFAGSTAQARFRFGSVMSDEGVWIDTVAVHPWVPDTWSGEAPEDLEGEDDSCPQSYDFAWEPVENAGLYNVYRSEISCEDAISMQELYGTTLDATFSDADVVEEAEYFYAVEALEADTGCLTERTCITGGCEEEEGPGNKPEGDPPQHGRD